jgi:tRNA (adenine22-N1)-methyltransferase
MERFTLKLSKRLKQIESMVTSDYTHIWDCCCDHGLLGSALLSRLAAPYIHFVDIVPDLMNELENKLQRFYPNSPSKWQIHCLDVEVLPIEQYEGKNLVIIAGVGGDLTTQFVNAIHQSHSTTNIDFLLCPVHHQFTLRQQLIQLDFSLKNEVLVEENQRFYEILLVSSPANTDDKQSKINPVGDLIWQTNTAEQSKVTVNYLNKTLNHFQRMQRSKNADIQHIIDAYRSVTI